MAREALAEYLSGASGIERGRITALLYHLYSLDEIRSRHEATADENDALPRIVCSEALLREPVLDPSP